MQIDGAVGARGPVGVQGPAGGPPPQPGVEIPSGAFVAKITNDAREDEMEENLKDVARDNSIFARHSRMDVVERKLEQIRVQLEKMDGTVWAEKESGTAVHFHGPRQPAPRQQAQNRRRMQKPS